MGFVSVICLVFATVAMHSLSLIPGPRRRASRSSRLDRLSSVTEVVQHATSTPLDQTVDTFDAWAAEKGILHPKAKAVTLNGMRGVIATERILPGEVIMCIPLSLCFTPYLTAQIVKTLETRDNDVIEDFHYNRDTVNTFLQPLSNCNMAHILLEWMLFSFEEYKAYCEADDTADIELPVSYLFNVDATGYGALQKAVQLVAEILLAHESDYYEYIKILQPQKDLRESLPLHSNESIRDGDVIEFVASTRRWRDKVWTTISDVQEEILACLENAGTYAGSSETKRFVERFISGGRDMPSVATLRTRKVEKDIFEYALDLIQSRSSQMCLRTAKEISVDGDTDWMQYGLKVDEMGVPELPTLKGSMLVPYFDIMNHASNSHVDFGIMSKADVMLACQKLAAGEKPMQDDVSPDMHTLDDMLYASNHQYYYVAWNSGDEAIMKKREICFDYGSFTKSASYFLHAYGFVPAYDNSMYVETGPTMLNSYEFTLPRDIVLPYLQAEDHQEIPAKNDDSDGDNSYKATAVLDLLQRVGVQLSGSDKFYSCGVPSTIIMRLAAISATEEELKKLIEVAHTANKQGMASLSEHVSENDVALFVFNTVLEYISLAHYIRTLQFAKEVLLKELQKGPFTEKETDRLENPLYDHYREVFGSCLDWIDSEIFQTQEGLVA